MAALVDNTGDVDDQQSPGIDPTKTSANQSSVHNDTRVNDTVSAANGWNGTFVKADDPYALKRDCNASSRLVQLRLFKTLTNSNLSVRLTAQHYLWKDLLGFLLHQDIPTGSSDMRVADVATGNG